jgi:hypothetical protein
MSARIEELIGKLESCHDPALVATARDLARAIMDLHGSALERMLEIVFRSGAAGEAILEEFGRDELTAGVLALYGLHPLDLETRVRNAVNKLRASGTDVEFKSLLDGVLTIGLTVPAARCGSSADLRHRVVETINAAVPDVVRLVVDERPQAGFTSGFVPLEKLAGVRA